MTPSAPTDPGTAAARRANPGRQLQGLYSVRRWRHPEEGTRVRVLVRDMLECQRCRRLLVGAYPAPDSPVVDHIVPHEGNLALFWDEANLQALCKECHDGAKQRDDAARRTRGGGSIVQGGVGR